MPETDLDLDDLVGGDPHAVLAELRRVGPVVGMPSVRKTMILAVSALALENCGIAVWKAPEIFVLPTADRLEI